MKSILALGLVLGMSSSALAEEVPTEKREEVVNQRQENQDKRIEEGVKNGSLSPEEAKKLEAQQQHIQNKEKRAMADGKLDKKEFRSMLRTQDRASRNIKRKKHN